VTAESRVALVTGGARRVGAAVVEALAARGCRVVIHAARSVGEAERLADALRSGGGDARVVPADLRDPEAPSALVDAAARAFGRLDIVVNSAATFLHAPVDAISPALWDETFAVNVRAPFFIAQAAARHLPEGGVIVNIADHLAFEAVPSMVAHGASKAALVHVTQTLARALAPRVRVNAVAPGLVAMPEGWGEARLARFLQDVPLGRAGEARDVADAVGWLVDAPYVTGIVLRVDGGRTLRVAADGGRT
jgi:pteridine reductase